MRWTDRDDGGVSPEYVAVLVLVAAIVAAVLALQLAPTVAAAGRAAMCRLFDGGECDGSDPALLARDEDFRPESCEVGSRERVVAGSAKIAVVHLGGDYAFLRTTHSDGRTELTFVDKGRIGLEAGAGAHVDVTAGGDTYGAKLEAEAKATYGFHAGDTWVFDSADEADELESWIERERNEDRRLITDPHIWGLNQIGEWITGEPDPPEPRITFTEHEVAADGSASARAGIASAGAEAAAAAHIGWSHDVGEDRDDVSDDRNTDYYAVDFGVAGDLGVLTAAVGAGWDGAGVLEITYDVDDEPIELGIVDTSTGSLSGIADVDTEELGWETLTDRLEESSLAATGEGSTTHTIVTRTTVALEDAASRELVGEMADVLTGLRTATGEAAPGWLAGRETVTSANSAGSGLDRLLYEDGHVSIVEYDGETSGLEVSAAAALGLKLGLRAGSTTEWSSAVNAMYLGAPRDGDRRFVPFTDCVAGSSLVDHVPTGNGGGSW